MVCQYCFFDFIKFGGVIVLTTKPIYVGVPEEYYDKYLTYFDLKFLKGKYKQKKPGFHIQYARENPTSFAYFMLGKKIRPYQAYAMDMIIDNPETILDWARRLGKSTIIDILAFWMTYFNKYPKNAMEKFTVVGLVSKEGDAAKKLLAAVKQLVYDGDHRWHMITKNTVRECKDYFSRQLIEPTNSEQLTWANRSIIKSFPPTKKVKGWGFSFLFIDEMAYLDPKEEDCDSFYNLTCRPTLAECGGKIAIASTPAGQTGTYFDIFQPEDKIDTTFVRLWFNWKVADGDTPEEVTYRAWVMNERDRLRREGKDATFRQEFMGDFTVTQNSFFDIEDVTNYFDSKMCSQYTWDKSPCSIGIDFGISDCQTVITVKTKYRGKIILLYQREFPVNFDNNELMNSSNDDSIPRLFRRYDIQWLVPEDSSVSDMFVKWCRREGYPVFPYRFSGGNVGSKNTAFHTYRSMLKMKDSEGNNYMKSYPIDQLKWDMIGLQEKQEKINWIIAKPPGGRDDCMDSDIFATVPFFDNEGDTWGGVSDTEDVSGEFEQEIKRPDYRVDKSYPGKESNSLPSGFVGCPM